MNQRILLVGDNPILMETRTRLLEPLETVGAKSSEAVAALLGQPFGVIIIGQTVSTAIAEELSDLAPAKRIP